MKAKFLNPVAKIAVAVITVSILLSSCSKGVHPCPSYGNKSHHYYKR